MPFSITSRLQQLADDERTSSISHRLREDRFRLFSELAGAVPAPIDILDIGGTTKYWRKRGWAGRDDITITLVNLEAEEQQFHNIIPTAGDATDLRDHADGSYDIAYSNSVIEHLTDLESQSRMAREVQRVARAYWVQTPNFWFPIEPHFLMPAWHWLSEDARVAILRRRGVGWAGRCEDPEFARKIVREHRLMRRSELQQLFPNAQIVAERFGGLVKSWIAIGGFAPAELA